MYRFAPLVLVLLLIGQGVLLAAQFDTPWEVDFSGSNATGNGLGGGLVYTCASNAPSRGAIAGIFRDVSVRDGQYPGAVGDVTTRWQCVDSGTFATCFAAARDSARIRDLLIARDSVTVRLGPERDPLALALVGLRGSSRAISRVRRNCR